MRPFLEKLPDEAARARFEQEVLEDCREAYPAHAQGRVLFPFRRLFCVAVGRLRTDGRRRAIRFPEGVARGTTACACLAARKRTLAPRGIIMPVATRAAAAWLGTGHDQAEHDSRLRTHTGRFRPRRPPLPRGRLSLACAPRW